MKKTKIVCTLGPASSNEETLKTMLKSGMNVARLNFSHGTHETHKEMIALFRGVRDSMGVPAAVMMDTKGPEIRLKDFESGSVTIKDGDKFVLTTEEILGTATRASITYKDLPSQLIPGMKVLIDDGKVALEVIESLGAEIRCKIITGGTISNHKGINVPKGRLDIPFLSEADKSDLLFGIEQQVDFIAASFVRRKSDIVELRKFIDYNGGHNIKVISKIENLEGVENFDEILSVSDGIMIARGDMGVEIEFERLPGIQKRFIRKCYTAGKMVITATQMLESMVNNPSPTRAEITDVANAVFDGTSAVMLSGESAMGRYPALSVAVMAKIIRQAERDAFDMNIYREYKYDMDYTDNTNAICDAANTTARDIHAAAIIVVTKSGQTARRMSKFRPDVPIVAATPELQTLHQLSLSWGVYPVMSKYQKTSDELFQHSIDCARMLDVVHNGDKVVIAAGVPLSTSGTTNIIKVETVKGV